MAKKQRKKQGWAYGVRELARAVDRNHSAVLGWLRDPRWPFGPRGPWNVAAVKAWMAETLAAPQVPGVAESADDDTLPADGRTLGRALSVAKLGVMVERKANLRIDRLIKERNLIDRAEEEARDLKVLATFRGALQQIPRAMRALLAHQPPDEIERRLAAALRALCDNGFRHASSVPPPNEK